MSVYRFAEITMDISTDNKYIIDRMSSFLEKNSCSADMKIDIIKRDKIEKPEGNLIIDEELKWVKNSSDKGGFSAFMSMIGTGSLLAAVHTDEKWEKAEIEFIEDIVKKDSGFIASDYISFQAIGILFRNKLLLNKGIVIHASSIEHKGKGILFSAPSGTGKSTHVRIWEQYKENVLLLNDDSPALRIIDGKTYIFGTPWSGSSDKFLNRSAPLAAIVVLEQAPENSIQLLSKAEAATRLMPRMLLPYFDGGMMAEAIQNFDDVICNTPIYLLKCRPDREAMELVYDCVMR